MLLQLPVVLHARSRIRRFEHQGNRGATLIDGSGGPPIRDAIVVADGTRIQQVHSRDRRGPRDQVLLQRLDLRKEGASPSAHARVIFGHHRYNLDHMKSRLLILRTNLTKVWQAGIPVACGSDLAGAMVGVSSQIELVRIADAGLTPMQVLETATINVARMLQGTRAGDRGTRLNRDPLADIRNIRYIHRVLKNGVFFDPMVTDGAGRRVHGRE